MVESYSVKTLRLALSNQLITQENVWNGEAWNEIISTFPYNHILQTWEWGQFKSRYEWKIIPKIWRDASNRPVAAAMVLERAATIRGISLPLRIMYVPKGPLIVNWEQLHVYQRILEDLKQLACIKGALFLKVDPDIPLGYGIPGSQDYEVDLLGKELANFFLGNGWIPSSEQIQFQNTVILDLEADEDELLASMKQKTRYNVRLAKRKGVQVRTGSKSDLGLLYQMYVETAVRDGFVIRSQEYYSTLWSSFMDAEMAKPFIAEVEGQAVAAVVVFKFAGKAIYMFGMSRESHREKMPNYLLQWEATRWLKSIGCHEYDLWGAPDTFDQEDPLWGVYRFKEGLGGKVVRKFGAWDYPARPGFYRLYTEIMPRLLSVLRKRGSARIQQALDG